MGSETAGTGGPGTPAPGAVTTLVLAGALGAGAVWWGRHTVVLAGEAERGAAGRAAGRGVFGAVGVAACHAVAAAAMTATLLLVSL